MEGSTSETTTRSRPSSFGSSADDELSLSFGNLRMTNDYGTPATRGSSSRSSSSPSSFDFSSVQANEGANRAAQFFNTSPVNHVVADEPNASSRPLLFLDNVWAYNGFSNGDMSYPISSGSGDSRNNANSKSRFETRNRAGTLDRRTMRRNSLGGTSPNSSTLQFDEGSPLNVQPNVCNRGTSDYTWRTYMDLNGTPLQNSHAHHQVNATGSGGGFISGEIGIGNSSGLQSQHVGQTQDGCFKCSLVELARTESGSQYLQGIFLDGNCQQRAHIFCGVFDSILELMTDKYGSNLVLKILDECKDLGLRAVVLKMYNEKELFLNAAFDSYGSQSIQKLIKILRRTTYAFDLTLILSTRFYELSTHHISRHVIVQCLNSLGTRENEVLYEKAIMHFRELATHQQGCLSLNECINSISGPKREELLNLIADESSYLSNDPLGNYVVQHVLGLQNSRITDTICERLRGQYTQLSLKKGGSHVVEKCITFSRQGMNYVVEEFLRNNKTLIQLARDQYGNYVIQKALRVSQRADSGLFRSLTTALKDHITDISRGSSGRHVAELIKLHIAV